MLLQLVIIAIIVGGLFVVARKALARAKAIERIDPFTLTDPWRSFVQDAQQAQKRFERIAASVTDGPLQARLGAVRERVDDGAASIWRIAQAGHQLQKMIREVADSNTEPVTRMRSRATETRDKLAALTASLDEAVARGAELATGQYAELDAVAHNVDDVVDELEALRQAVAEISNQ